MTFSPGDAIMFMPGEVREDKRDQWRRGEFKGVSNASEGIVVVRLQGDPFDICTYDRQIRPATDKEKHMATSTKAKPQAKELRRQAKALGVEGWEDMTLDELVAAVESAQEAESGTKSKKGKKAPKKAAPVVDEDDEDEDDEDEDDEDDEDEDDEEEEEEAPKASKKAKGKKAAPAKKAAKASKPAKTAKASTKKADKSKSKAKASAAAENENGNPYQVGTNLYHMAEALIKGGKVSTLVKNLRKKVEINPRSREYDEDSLNAELQRRLIIVSQHLRNDYGFEMEKEGRGWDAVIRCYKDE